MTEWPVSIPFFDLRSGYGAQPGENTIRTEMDIGPAKTRRRTTAAPSRVTGMAYMTREEAQRFEAFYRDTLLDGAMSFTKTDGQWRQRNLLVQSEDFSAGWVVQNGLTRFDAVSVVEGATASRLQCDSSIGSQGISQEVGVLSGGVETFTIILENVDATVTAFGIRDMTASIWRAFTRLNWSVTTIGAGGTVAQLGTGPNGGALVRLTVSAAGTGGNIRRLFIYPGDTGLNSTAAIIHTAQLETGPSFTSYEPVGASYPATHVTRGGTKTYRFVGVPSFDLMGRGHGVPVTLEVLP